MRLHNVARREALALTLSATCNLLLSRPSSARQEISSTRVSWGPFKGLSDAQIDELDERSRDPTAGVTLDGGLRVIDLVVGPGPQPQRGDRVYVHYKVWANGFRVGQAADYSFADNRPYSWTLGQSNDRLPRTIDDGLLGMREGGWRRVYLPDGFESGLRKVSRGPQGRYVGAKAPLLLQPGAPAYVDLIMLDGGSGRCERFLRPPGASEKEMAKLVSLTCSARMEIF